MDRCARKRRWTFDMYDRIVASLESAVASAAGLLLFCYYRLVRSTNRVVQEPEATFYEPLDTNKAVIYAVWHGEHFLTPLLARRGDRLYALVTLHRDGEFVARMCGHFGVPVIRGSGGHGGDFVRKKAVTAFFKMLRVLREGGSLIVTADVPKVSRIAGLGVATLARHSGCPIVPVAITTSRRYRLSNWDQTCINLPFGRMMMVRGKPVYVPADADEAALESARQQVQTGLDAVTERAYVLAG